MKDKEWELQAAEWRCHERVCRESVCHARNKKREAKDED